MIRTITYTFLLLTVILMGCNLTISHALATDGEKITFLGDKSKQAMEEIEELEIEIVKAQSLDTLITKAEEMGLTDPVKQRVLNSRGELET